MAKEQVKFSDEFIHAARATVNYIAPDAMEACETNYELLEMVLDANRLLTCGGSQAAEDELHALLKMHSFKAIIRALEARGFCYI